MCRGFWHQHPAHPCWEVTKGASEVSLVSFSGCAKHSCPQSLICPIWLFFQRQLSDPISHQLRNESGLSHHQFTKAMFWHSLESWAPWHILSHQPRGAHCFYQCLPLSHLFPLLMHLLNLGCSFPISVPGSKFHPSQISDSSLDFCYFWAAQSMGFEVLTPENFLHTLPLGQMHILNPIPLSSRESCRLYSTRRKKQWTYEQTAKIRKEERIHSTVNQK